jgi:hypothetical protein
MCCILKERPKLFLHHLLSPLVGPAARGCTILQLGCKIVNEGTFKKCIQ